jgi:transcriptional regulator with XRE-family HTH domain
VTLLAIDFYISNFYNSGMEARMFSLRIKRFRRRNGITQTQLAQKVGISQSFLSEVENGKYDITLTLLFKIARALDVCPFDLVEFRKYKK